MVYANSYPSLNLATSYSMYKIPVIKNRDVSVYSVMQPGTIKDPSDRNSVTMTSMSCPHPGIPNVKGCVRGDLGIGCAAICLLTLYPLLNLTDAFVSDCFLFLEQMHGVYVSR